MRDHCKKSICLLLFLLCNFNARPNIVLEFVKHGQIEKVMQNEGQKICP